MKEGKLRFPTRPACCLAGIVAGLLLSPLKNGVHVRVSVRNGAGGTKKSALEAGFGCRAGREKKA